MAQVGPPRPKEWTEPPSGQWPTALDPAPDLTPPPMPPGSAPPPDGQRGPRDTMPNWKREEAS